MTTKLVGGWGINDLNIPARNPLYEKWKKMIYRCVLPHDKSYSKYGGAGVTICPEWKNFSNFYQWASQYDWEGKEIDKDLLVNNNKIYSPNTCCFLSRPVNTFLTGLTHGSTNEYPPGVSLNPNQSKLKPYKAQCCDLTGRQKFLGRYKTPLEAYKAYVEYKSKLTLKYALKENDLRIRKGLIRFANDLIEDYYYRESQ